jgi:hypothetical protein
VIARAVGVALVLAPGAAAAQAPYPQPAPPARAASLTISPVHLILPMLELAGEANLGDRVGVALIAGAGSAKLEDGDGRVTIYALGGSARIYPFDAFEGVHAGVEAIFVRGTTDAPGATVIGDGVSIGAFAGYKWIHGSGFTLEGQLGIQAIGVAASSSEGDTAESRDYGPLLNLNVGWSF